jgi:NAD-dependent DNA ligase
MGLTMNEHGLYKLEGKKKGEKVAHKFETEKDIFDYLNMEYKSPEERIDGRAVVTKLVKPKLKIVTDSDEVIEEPLPAPKKEVIDTNILTIASNFKKNGIKVLEELNENQLSSILREANKAYYNEEPFLSDNQYDIVKEFMEKKYPSAAVIAEIGAPVERNKVKLPYFMGSMDKIKPDTDALKTWQSKFKGPYVLSCKLDGVSGLYTTEGSAPKLYTRGDGKVGQDISHLIPHLRLPKTKGIVIRGEFIIPKAVFETKYKDKFANPRNMVSGIVNHKSISEAVKDLHFVAYEVLKPEKNPSEQMKLLSTLDVECVLYKIESTLTNDLLSETLVDWRKSYAYEIDGVIVTNDKIYERKSGNPDHAFAFKMVLSDQIAEAKVVDVIWTPSKDGYLKPRVQIEPINLGGVRIEYATGFNGAFINDNKIGIGAIIELIRSGDVIPHIRKVTMPAPEAKMPNVSYKWNETHVDIMLEDISTDETVKEKVITGFFRGLNVEGLSSGNVKRIIATGYDTVPKILKMTMEDLLKVEGFKEKTAKKLYDGIREKIEEASITMIMSASNIFGRGFSDKKLELIMNEYPNVLLSKESKDQKISKVAAIKGMAQKTAEAFVERIPELVQFIKEINLDKKLTQIPVEKVSVDQSHPLYNKSIVMTGFRDQDLQNKLKSIGAKLGTSVSKNTFVVLVKDLEEDTGKALDAKNLGIPLMTPEEFKKKYNM